MTIAQAKRIVREHFPNAFGVKANGVYRVMSGQQVPLFLARAKTAAEAWERAAVDLSRRDDEGEK